MNALSLPVRSRTLALLFALPFAATGIANAIPSIGLTHQGSALIVVEDNGPLDSNAAPGVISYTGTVGDYVGTFTGIVSPQGTSESGAPFMVFSGSYERVTNTSNFAFIAWLIGTDLAPIRADQLGYFTFSGAVGGSISGWSLNPPNQTTIGTSLIHLQQEGYASLPGDAPFSLMNTIHLSPSSPLAFTSTASIVNVPDAGSIEPLAVATLLGLLLAQRNSSKSRKTIPRGKRHLAAQS